jgi:hypothetical protein
MDNPFVAKEGTLHSMESEKIDHRVDNRIVGITPCKYCQNTCSTFRAPSGEVYCSELHREAEETK